MLTGGGEGVSVVSIIKSRSSLSLMIQVPIEEVSTCRIRTSMVISDQLAPRPKIKIDAKKAGTIFK